MKKLLFIVFTSLLTLSTFAQSYDTNLPDCKNHQGDILQGTDAELQKVVTNYNPADRHHGQVLVKGVVTLVLPEDHRGNPHQKFIIEVKKGLTLKVVTNLDFQRIPVQVGQSAEVCGEYAVNSYNHKGLVHWTHYDRRGHHPDGFTVLNGMVYGETYTPGQQ